MSHVFHIHKKYARIPKKFYTPESRKSFTEWNEAFHSQVGYVNGNTLVLPDKCRDEVDLKRAGGIMLQDIYGYSGTKSEVYFKRQKEAQNLPDWFMDQKLKNRPELFYFKLQRREWSFEIFAIEKSDSDIFDLHLKYGSNSFSIGEPKRNDHKLYTFGKDQRIKILINGKSDSTMTRGAERTYTEYEYVIEYLGVIDKIEFAAPNKIEIERSFPTTVDKTIDLRKILY